jgi:hypothetical protein
MQRIEKWSRRGGRRGVAAVAAATAVLVGIGGASRHGGAAARETGADPYRVPAARPDAERDQPVGRFGRDAVGTLPGVVPPHAVPPDVDAAVRDLAEEHTRGRAGMPRGAVSLPMPELRENPLAPPRMDAGDANPDRHGAAPLTRRRTDAREARP